MIGARLVPADEAGVWRFGGQDGHSTDPCVFFSGREGVAILKSPITVLGGACHSLLCILTASSIPVT